MKISLIQLLCIFLYSLKIQNKFKIHVKIHILSCVNLLYYFKIFVDMFYSKFDYFIYLTK